MKRLFRNNRVKVKILLCSRENGGLGKIIGTAWTVKWPRHLSLPVIGEVVMLPAPPNFISAFHHQIMVVVKERILYADQCSADLYVCELFPNENWHDIARRIRHGYV